MLWHSLWRGRVHLVLGMGRAEVIRLDFLIASYNFNAHLDTYVCILYLFCLRVNLFRPNNCLSAFFDKLKVCITNELLKFLDY
jgi:hypothetical protein